jgi:3-oxoadipate enol-lactonase/4-carboxymuconolactone decarboxylase
MAEETTKIDVGGHQLRYRSEGEGDRTIVLLHGFAETIDIWQNLLPEISGIGRLIVLEQRAHGWSTAPEPPYAWEDLAGDVVKALDGLGIAKATFIGHSLGGIVALLVAKIAPERVDDLVLIGTTTASTVAQQKWIDEVVKSGRMNGIEGLAHAIWGPMSREKVEGQPIGLTEVARLLQRLGQDSLTLDLASIGARTLCLAGTEDPIWPDAVAAVAGALRSGAREGIESADHWPHRGQPAETAAAIRRFLGAAS